VLSPQFSVVASTRAALPDFAPLRRSELIGRPLGAPGFMEAIGPQLDRIVTPGERAPKPKGACRRNSLAFLFTRRL
jgi:putative transposase